MEHASDLFGESISWSSIDEAVISHAHIDHFGNAGAVRDRGIPIAVHALDARVLARFVERLAIAARDVALYLRQAGVDADTSESLLHRYRGSKALFEAVRPDTRLRHNDLVGPGWRVIHDARPLSRPDLLARRRCPAHRRPLARPDHTGSDAPVHHAVHGTGQLPPLAAQGRAAPRPNRPRPRGTRGASSRRRVSRLGDHRPSPPPPPRDRQGLLGRSGHDRRGQ